MDILDQNIFSQMYITVSLKTPEGGNYQDPYIGYTKEEADKILAWFKLNSYQHGARAIEHIQHSNKDHGDKISGKTFKITYFTYYNQQEKAIKDFINYTNYNFNNNLPGHPSPTINIDNIDWYVTCDVV